MLYCFNLKEINEHKYANEDIEYAKKNGVFIYFNENTNEILDEFDNIVDVNNKEVLPVSFVKQLPNMIEALTKKGAIIPNNIESINKVKEWYKYIETKRLIVSFKGKCLHDPEFLNYIYEVFKNNPEVFLKTKEKDFNGLVDLTDFFDEKSDLRKAFSYHEEEDFILSEKVDINQDEIGYEEYRVFVYKNRIMNISRNTDTIYHEIPSQVIEYAEDILTSLPSSFPKTFVLDIFSYQHMLDILEFNPLEASGRYLYNSIFSISDDLSHSNIKKVPEERDKRKLSYENNESLVPSKLSNVPNTFAKDYEDFKRFNTRVDGFIHIDGLPSNCKIDLASILSNMTLVEEDDLSSKKQLSLTKKES